jgi:hypothetical protein
MPKEIPAEIAEYLHYDPASGHLTWTKVTHPKIKVGSRAGCINTQGYRVVRFNGNAYYAHRIAWFMHYGEQPPEHLDHVKYEEKDDNSIANLRIATRSEQTVNQGDKTRKHGLPRNVYRNGDKFKAEVQRTGVNHYVGTFESKEEAHEAALKFIADFDS